MNTMYLPGATNYRYFNILWRIFGLPKTRIWCNQSGCCNIAQFRLWWGKWIWFNVHCDDGEYIYTNDRAAESSLIRWRYNQNRKIHLYHSVSELGYLVNGQLQYGTSKTHIPYKLYKKRLKLPLLSKGIVMVGVLISLMYITNCMGAL